MVIITIVCVWNVRSTLHINWRKWTTQCYGPNSKHLQDFDYNSVLKLHLRIEDIDVKINNRITGNEWKYAGFSHISFHVIRQRRSMKTEWYKRFGGVMFWTSKDKPSASDTVTQSCSLWQRWVSRRNIGCSSVQSSSFPGFSDLDSLRLCFLPDFCPGDPRPGLSNSGLLQPPWHQLWVRRKSECRVRAVPQEICFLDIQPQVLLRRGGILSNVPHVCGGVLRIIQEILLPVSQWSVTHFLSCSLNSIYPRHHLQPGEAGLRCLVQCWLFRGHHRQWRHRPGPSRCRENLHLPRVGVWRAREGLSLEIPEYRVEDTSWGRNSILFKIGLHCNSLYVSNF